MNPELTQKLRDEFPVLFGPNEWGEFLRGFGFECDDGWYELIREFGLAVNKLQDPDNPVVALIVKEKFGALEMQGFTNMNDELWKVKREIYDRSTKTCEVCGKPGQQISSGYWIFTRCPEHTPEPRPVKQTCPTCNGAGTVPAIEELSEDGEVSKASLARVDCPHCKNKHK